MKAGDKVKVLQNPYEDFPVDYEGLITSFEAGWDDEGNVAIVYYVDHKARNPFLAHELEVLS